MTTVYMNRAHSNYHLIIIHLSKGRLYRGLVQLFNLRLCRSCRLCDSGKPRPWQTHQRDCLGIHDHYDENNWSLIIMKTILITIHNSTCTYWQKNIETLSNPLAWLLWLIQRQRLQWTCPHFGLFIDDDGYVMIWWWLYDDMMMIIWWHTIMMHIVWWYGNMMTRQWQIWWFLGLFCSLLCWST